MTRAGMCHADKGTCWSEAVATVSFLTTTHAWWQPAAARPWEPRQASTQQPTGSTQSLAAIRLLLPPGPAQRVAVRCTAVLQRYSVIAPAGCSCELRLAARRASQGLVHYLD